MIRSTAAFSSLGFIRATSIAAWTSAISRCCATAIIWLPFASVSVVDAIEPSHRNGFRPHHVGAGAPVPTPFRITAPGVWTHREEHAALDRETHRLDPPQQGLVVLAVPGRPECPGLRRLLVDQVVQGDLSGRLPVDDLHGQVVGGELERLVG